MKNDNIIQQKSFAFAVKIVKLYRYFVDTKKEFILAKQLLKSGTSIGANIEEAIGGHSKPDFIAKMTISYKEARESQYWIKLLQETNFLTKEESESLLSDIDEILKILGSILKTSKHSDS